MKRFWRSASGVAAGCARPSAANWIGAALLATGLAAGGALAAESDYPSRPIRLVVPYATGGSTDVLARLVAAKMGERLKQSMIVENKPGANAVIGGQIVARSAPDGYTLLSVGGSNYSSVMMKDPPIDIMKDFAPVGMIYYGAHFLMINADIPARTIREFITYTKANPGKVNFSSAAPNSMLAMELFKKAAGLEMVHVPYKGAGPAAVALLTGEVHATMNFLLAYQSYVESGKVRALAVAADERFPAAPSVPTMSEAGLPGFRIVYNGGLWAPAGTPRNVIEVLNRVVADIVKLQEVRDPILAGGLLPKSATPEAFRQAVQAEIEFWAGAAKLVGYKPES